MVDSAEHSINKEELVTLFFTKEMEFNELQTFFYQFHLNTGDFHIHNNQLTKYVYANFKQADNRFENQMNEIFWEKNIENLKTYIDVIIKYEKEHPDQNPNRNEHKLILNNQKEMIQIPDKMREHIGLALLQYETFLDKIDNMQIKADKLSTALDEKGKELEKATKKLNNSTANFISILGIYSALIFGVFGGFDAFKAIFSSMGKTPISTVLIDGSLLMIGLITLVFILLQSIGILSGKAYLACGHSNTSECDCSFSKRYPIFSLTLKIFFGILVFGSIVHIANRTELFYQNSWRIGLATVGTLLLIYLSCNVIKTTKYLKS
ncbi:hypothetical protein [Limosilactobacillus mucosae]|nr:hypothetical protein [Limosilactobacillus mucosae]MDM8314707.1 hypothetical protein [Limosilactobacillus mucosae]